MSGFVPTLDHWYQDRETGQLFEVVALDPDQSSIQVQFVDGELANFELEAWAELTLQHAAAPEDWRVAFELDDFAGFDTDNPTVPMQGSSPLATIETDIVLCIDQV